MQAMDNDYVKQKKAWGMTEADSELRQKRAMKNDKKGWQTTTNANIERRWKRAASDNKCEQRTKTKGAADNWWLGLKMSVNKW
jgi:hypothetical protein